MMGAGRRGTAQTEANVKRETLAARSMNGIIASGTRVTAYDSGGNDRQFAGSRYGA